MFLGKVIFLNFSVPIGEAHFPPQITHDGEPLHSAMGLIGQKDITVLNSITPLSD